MLNKILFALYFIIFLGCDDSHKWEPSVNKSITCDFLETSKVISQVAPILELHAAGWTNIKVEVSTDKIDWHEVYTGPSIACDYDTNDISCRYIKITKLN